MNELEQRLAVYKEQAHQKDIEHRLAVQKVDAENRHLRALLGSLGVSSASVQQYLHEANTGANVNRKVAIPAIQRVEGENPLSLSRRDARRSNLSMGVSPLCKEEPETPELPAAVNSACSSTIDQPEPVRNACTPAAVQPTERPKAVRSACASTTVQPTDQPKAVRSACSSTTVHLTEQREAVRGACAPAVMQSTDQPPQQAQQEDPALCGCRSDGDNPEMASDEDVLNSTLCAIAEEMINQYNTKGIEVDEIRRRIWSGFRAGANGTGCRVQNHILFQVLDDISSDV